MHKTIGTVVTYLRQRDCMHRYVITMVEKTPEGKGILYCFCPQCAHSRLDTVFNPDGYAAGDVVVPKR
jgi:hypothetical protein